MAKQKLKFWSFGARWPTVLLLVCFGKSSRQAIDRFGTVEVIVRRITSPSTPVVVQAILYVGLFEQ